MYGGPLAGAKGLEKLGMRAEFTPDLIRGPQVENGKDEPWHTS
jgi:hypothetical protein